MHASQARCQPRTVDLMHSRRRARKFTTALSYSYCDRITLRAPGDIPSVTAAYSAHVATHGGPPWRNALMTSRPWGYHGVQLTGSGEPAIVSGDSATTRSSFDQR